MNYGYKYNLYHSIYLVQNTKYFKCYLVQKEVKEFIRLNIPLFSSIEQFTTKKINTIIIEKVDNCLF